MNEFDYFSIQDPELEYYLRLAPLVQGVFSNLSMFGIMERVETILFRPVMVIDMGFKIIDESPSINDSYRLYERSDIFLVESCIDQIKANHIYWSLMKREYSSTLITFPEYGNFMVSSIKINASDVMMLLVFENGQPFELSDYILVKKISSILAVQYQKQDIAYSSHMVYPNHIVFALLNGEHVTREEFTRRVGYFPWNKYEKHYLLLIDDAMEGNDFRPRHGAILKSLLAFIEEDHCLTYKNLIVGFLGQKQFENLYQDHRKEFEDYLVSNDLVCSISQVYTNIMESRKYYLSSLKLLHCARKYKLRMACFADSHFYVLYDLIASHDDPAYFIHPVVKKLINYDNEYTTDLLDTLEVYLSHRAEPDLAAEYLHIHRSTLYYRIKKIREITECDIENFKEMTEIYFSLQIHKIQTSLRPDRGKNGSAKS